MLRLRVKQGCGRSGTAELLVLPATAVLECKLCERTEISTSTFWPFDTLGVLCCSQAMARVEKVGVKVAGESKRKVRKLALKHMY